jgi:FemAB-related protein (PEP-CTERM system-associated)
MLTVQAAAGEQEWDAFVEGHPGASGYHLWRWRRVFARAFGHRSEYLIARDEHGVRGILPLVLFEHRVFGRFAVSLPFVNYGGVLADDPAAARALMEASRALAASRRLSHVELRHTGQLFPDLAAKQHKVSMHLALEPDRDRAWAALDKKVRNQVRKAEKSELTVVDGGAELLPEFYAVFNENMRDLGTPVYTPRFFEAVLSEFQAAARVFLVRQGEATVAGGITYAYRETVEVPWAASLKRARPFCPNNLLYWRVIEWAIASGFCVLDFGRSTPNEGTFHFKEQWGARPVPLCWEYALVSQQALPDRSPKNPKLQTAIAVWKHLPVGLTSVIGPPIVRFLP